MRAVEAAVLLGVVGLLACATPEVRVGRPEMLLGYPHVNNFPGWLMPVAVGFNPGSQRDVNTFAFACKEYPVWAWWNRDFCMWAKLSAR